MTTPSTKVAAAVYAHKDAGFGMPVPAPQEKPQTSYGLTVPGAAAIGMLGTGFMPGDPMNVRGLADRAGEGIANFAQHPGQVMDQIGEGGANFMQNLPDAGQVLRRMGEGGADLLHNLPQTAHGVMHGLGSGALGQLGKDPQAVLSQLGLMG